jgi:hypothetical protein
MKIFFLFLFFVITSFSASAQFKPEAMILPISFVNFNDTALQESLDNFVQTELSSNFELKSKDEVDEAMEKAIDEMDSENCTQEACIKKMGRMLDVDYTFNLKIIDTGQVWDLIAIRIHYFENRTMRRTELCNNCSLTKARKLISAMLSTMGTGEVSLKGGKSRLLVESTPRSAVFIDGYPQGETPLDLSVDANKTIEILMVAEGYNDFTEELILKPGEKVSINKKLVRKRGNIRITSEPSGATIYIDGKLELDAQEKRLKTPADLYMLFGEHELKLKYERYEDSTQTLKINKRKLGTKKIILKPKPGRLIIRVPSEFKSADVYVDGKSMGDMDGQIVQTFEVRANVSQIVQVKDGDFESKIKSFEIGPDDHKKIEFSEFSDLRLVELRKQKEAKKRNELRDRQERLKAEEKYGPLDVQKTKRKEQTEKMKKLFENTRVEIRTYGHLLDGAAYSLYFYFDPRFAIGYFHEEYNGESNPSSTATYYEYDTTFKYRVEHAGYVLRFRLVETDNYGWNSLRYLVDSWGLSLFSSSGKITSRPPGRSSKIKPSAMTIDYVWYWQNGFSILLGLGLGNYNADEDWTNNWGDFEGMKDFGWGLFNIGYMF